MMMWMQSGWFWWSLALLLFAVEVIAPGAFMLWLGLGAAAAGLVVLLIPGMSLATQWIVFGVLALVSTGIGWRYRRRLNRDAASDQPLLNRKTAQLMDRVFELQAPIVNGRGKVKIGDALWTVEGDDMPTGQRVRVVGVDGMVLRVHAAG
ncbi:MAG: NfeD family protein [Xanthomonadales bacterium]|nr:NfeD family protein [Xanthomonadales bacterium]